LNPTGLFKNKLVSCFSLALSLSPSLSLFLSVERAFSREHDFEVPGARKILETREKAGANFGCLAKFDYRRKGWEPEKNENLRKKL